jgi:hypothetical protein
VFSCNCDFNNAGVANVSLYTNGVSAFLGASWLVYDSAGNSRITGRFVSPSIYLSSNDYVETYCNNSGGGSPAVLVGNVTNTWFSGWRISK